MTIYWLDCFIFLFTFSVTVSHWYHQPGLSGEINGAKPFIKKYKTHYKPILRTEQTMQKKMVITLFINFKISMRNEFIE